MNGKSTLCTATVLRVSCPREVAAEERRFLSSFFDLSVLMHTPFRRDSFEVACSQDIHRAGALS
jgi:hypothetical protein